MRLAALDHRRLHIATKWHRIFGRRLFVRCFLCWCLFGLCLALPGGAETVLLDAEVGSGSLLLETHRAEVHVFIDAAGENFIQAIDPAKQPQIDAASLQLTRQGNAVQVQRSVGENESPGPPDLRFDIVLTPGTPLTLRGHGLSIVIEDTSYVQRASDPASEEVSEDNPAASAIQAQTSAASAAAMDKEALLRLEVKNSEVEVWGVANLAVTSEGGHLRFEGTQESLRLETSDSVTSLVRHRGLLQVHSQGGEMVMDDGRGQLELDWTGGELSVHGGEGALVAHLSGTALEFDGWRGDITVEGDNSLVSGREGRSSGQGFVARGKFLEVQLDEWRGKVTMFLEGGRVSGGPWRGKSAVTASKGASVDLEPLFGELRLWLRTDARASLHGITGLLKVDLDNSELELDGTTRNLEFNSKGSTANLRGAVHIRKLRASSSEVSVDLSQIQGSRPTIEALDGSQVRIDALAPCLVDINAPSAIESLDLDISGCEFKQLGIGRRKHAPRRTDGSRMTRLVVRLSEDSSIDVEGR